MCADKVTRLLLNFYFLSQYKTNAFYLTGQWADNSKYIIILTV